MHELGVLKHVSFALEAFAAGATGDGKREIEFLLERVGADAALAADCRDELVRRLKCAQAAITGPTGYRGVLGELAGATSYLWTRVHPGWAYDS